MAGETLATLLARPRASFQEGRADVQALERGRLQNIIVGDRAANLDADRAAATAATDLARRNTIAQREEAAAKALRDASDAERADALRTSTDFAGITDQAGFDAFKRTHPVDTKESGLTNSLFGDEIFQAKMEDAGLILRGAERLEAIGRAPVKDPGVTTQVRGSELGLTGEDENRLFNKDEQGNITAITGRPTASTQTAAAKAPAGFRFMAGGESLEAIPGGPQDTTIPKDKKPISAESAGKVAGIKQSLAQDIPFVIETLFGPGALESGDLKEFKLLRLPFTEGTGKIREARQSMRRAINAVLRAESGAAIPPSEIVEAMDLYFPDLIDSDAGARRKVTALLTRMTNFIELVDPDGVAGPTPAVPTAPVNGGANDPLGIRQ